MSSAPVTGDVKLNMNTFGWSRRIVVVITSSKYQVTDKVYLNYFIPNKLKDDEWKPLVAKVDKKNFPKYYPPMAASQLDGEEVVKFFKGFCGWNRPEDDVFYLPDAPGEVISKKLGELYEALSPKNRSKMKPGKVLLVIYYSGHGVIGIGRDLWCVAVDGGQFPIETALEQFGLLPDVYELGIFDCCRVTEDQNLVYARKIPFVAPKSWWKIFSAKVGGAAQSASNDKKGTDDDPQGKSLFTHKLLKYLQKYPDDPTKQPLYFVPKTLESFNQENQFIYEVRESSVLKEMTHLKEFSSKIGEQMALFMAFDSDRSGSISVDEVISKLSKFGDIAGGERSELEHYIIHYMRYYSSDEKCELNYEQFGKFYDFFQSDLKGILEQINQERNAKDIGVSAAGASFLYKIWQEAEKTNTSRGVKMEHWMQWEHFWPIWTSTIPPYAQKEDRKEEEEVLKKFLRVDEDEKVHFDHYNVFVKLFSPLVPYRCENSLIIDLINISRKSWFRFYSSRREVMEELEERAQGKCAAIVRITTNQGVNFIFSRVRASVDHDYPNFEENEVVDHTVLSAKKYYRVGLCSYVEKFARSVGAYLL